MNLPGDSSVPTRGGLENKPVRSTARVKPILLVRQYISLRCVRAEKNMGMHRDAQKRDPKNRVTQRVRV